MGRQIAWGRRKPKSGSCRWFWCITAYLCWQCLGVSVGQQLSQLVSCLALSAAGGLGRRIAPRGMCPSKKSFCHRRSCLYRRSWRSRWRFLIFVLDSSVICIDPAGVQRTWRPCCSAVLKTVSTVPLDYREVFGFPFHPTSLQWLLNWNKKTPKKQMSVPAKDF